MSKFIPIYTPKVAKNQKKYVNDCLDTNWISSRGSYIDKFEEDLAKELSVSDVITTCNGSVSLMLLLTALGIGLKDEVITQTLTYAATVSSIMNVGAVPVLIDSDHFYQMDIDLIEKAITKRTKAVMVAQLYGDTPDLHKLKKICDNHGVYLIEDSAECFGCYFDGEPIGSFGIASSFSFFGNKSITTGEGGCVATSDKDLAKKMRLLKSQSHIGSYRHSGPGYNFRMTNIQAAIGYAQLEDLDEINRKKRYLADFYHDKLDSSIGRIEKHSLVTSAEWMPLFTLPKTITYLKFHDSCKARGIDTRPCFPPIHLMEGFKFKKGSPLVTSEKIYKKGFNLPSFPDLTREQLQYVVDNVNEIVNKIGD